MSSFLSDQSVDHRLIDFDVFSNTQAETFGSKVTGCSATETNGILLGWMLSLPSFGRNPLHLVKID